MKSKRITFMSEKASEAAKREASSPIHSPPPKKHSDLVRYNTTPLRSRQSPHLLAEKVFTSLVEGESDDRPGEFDSSPIITPRTDPLEAVTVEEVPLTTSMVDLASPRDAYTSSGSTACQNSPRRNTFNSYVAAVSFSPSDAPSHHSEVSLAPVEQWIHRDSIADIIGLLGRPMSRIELRV